MELFLNTTCGKVNSEAHIKLRRITPVISDLCTAQEMKLAVKTLDPWLFPPAPMSE